MELVLARLVSETEVIFFLSGACLLRLTTQLNLPPYIDLPMPFTDTRAH